MRQILNRLCFSGLTTLTLAAGAAQAEGDTTVTVKKGEEPDFTVISDTAEVAGDPFTADADARESWKKACDKWKAEMRELNKDNLLIALSCGAPKATRAEGANTIYSSNASYKVRVRIRNEGKKTP